MEGSAPEARGCREASLVRWDRAASTGAAMPFAKGRGARICVSRAAGMGAGGTTVGRGRGAVGTGAR